MSEQERDPNPTPPPADSEIHTTVENLPPEEREAPPPERAMEEAYFHINNGGLTLCFAESAVRSALPSRWRYVLRASASHFGPGTELAIPLLNRGMVRWLAEAARRVADYLDQHPEHDLGILDDKSDTGMPWLKVVNGVALPRRVVRREYSNGGISMTWTENNTAEVAAEVAVAAPPDPSQG